MACVGIAKIIMACIAAWSARWSGYTHVHTRTSQDMPEHKFEAHVCTHVETHWLSVSFTQFKSKNHKPQRVCFVHVLSSDAT